MGKNKLARFRENETFSHLVQPPFMEVRAGNHALRGCWGADFFGNPRPITLELGCGRGEYTLALGSAHPARNFIGVDIKGARLWYGAKRSLEFGLANVGYLRTRIEVLGSLFAPGEISEIWITFPDPQLKVRREKKRLTGPAVLALYQRVLTPGGTVHLKTDSAELFEYTLGVLADLGITPQVALADVDSALDLYPDLRIATKYELHFRALGKAIRYLRFSLPAAHALPAEPAA